MEKTKCKPALQSTSSLIAVSVPARCSRLRLRSARRPRARTPSTAVAPRNRRTGLWPAPPDRSRSGRTRRWAGRSMWPGWPVGPMQPVIQLGGPASRFVAAGHPGANLLRHRADCEPTM
jgi:hypothetical protein